jgi:hypothetical protein
MNLNLSNLVNKLRPLNQSGLTQTKTNPEPATPVQATTEPIVGLRVWHIQMLGGMRKLKSVSFPILWPYRKALEKDPIHHEGIHAVKPGPEIVSLFLKYEAQVAGEVYLWGKVVECEFGYLADFAYPKRLFLPGNFCPVAAMQLEEEYGVPCEYREELICLRESRYVAVSDEAPPSINPFAQSPRIYPGGLAMKNLGYHRFRSRYVGGSG